MKYKKLNIFAFISFLITILLSFSSCSLFDNTTTSNIVETTKPPSRVETYNPNIYGYNNIENETTKKIYNQIKEHYQEINSPQLSVDVYNCSEKYISESITAFKNDYPDAFWLKDTFSYSSDDNATNIDLDYSITGNDLINAKKTFDKKIKAIINSSPKNGTQYDYELFVNNYICQNCTYDTAAANSNSIIENESDAYGALIKGKAVCEGYSRAFQLLCNKLGIDCVNVSGQAKEGHQWNCAKIDGNWYNVDVTWNDSENEWSNNDYFNLSDKQISDNHTTEPLYSEISDEEYLSETRLIPNVFVPKCSSTKYNYYRQSGIVINDISNDNKIVEALSLSSKNKENYFSMVIDDNLDFDSTANAIIENYYLSDWIDKANQKNSYNPELKQNLEVYTKKQIGVLTVVLKYT